MKTEILQQIMRWDMVVLQQSTWYQQILQEGIKIGQQQGIEISQQRGILSGIELGLELKFGSSGKEIFSEINTIENIQLLETILTSLKTVETIDQLRQIYLK
ncbi:hypothetical protein [Dapis sp. BLCC M229]|uniref:hypothetical protein n=1 Tax=Dapis sp. BLCC M229 TaxID=3400188 RepID=UPI003CF64CAC